MGPARFAGSSRISGRKSHRESSLRRSEPSTGSKPARSLRGTPLSSHSARFWDPPHGRTNDTARKVGSLRPLSIDYMTLVRSKAAGPPIKIAYIVSRFPLTTETFIARELAAVASDPRVEVSLLSLFPGGTTAVPEDAQPWTGKLITTSPLASVSALALWCFWSPRRLAAALAAVIWDYRKRPRVLPRALVTVFAALAHARVVRRKGISHVHAHFATYPALAAWLIARLTGSTFSFTGHAHDLYIHQAGIARRAREARFVAAISQFNRGFIAALAGTSVRQVIVRYGIHLEKYRLRQPPAAPHPPVVAMVSSFRGYKGHRVLIDALASDPSLRDVQVLLVGDGPLRPEIEQRAASCGVREQLQFLGWVPEVEVRQILLRADALVQPSVIAPSGDTEGLPNTLIEAMALGVPVIGTDVSGVSELIEHGRTGLMVEPGNAAALAHALRDVTTDLVSARQRAIEGRAKVERQHDLRREAGLLVRLFTEASAP